MERTPIHRLLMMKALSSGGGSLVEETVTGNPATFITNTRKPLTGMTIPFTPVQSGSGDPSPSNVRPITGFTGLTISVSGEDTSNPTTYPISWQTESGTLYGGYVNISTGELVSEWLYDDMGNYYWTNASGAGSAYVSIENVDAYNNNHSSQPFLFADQFKVIPLSDFNSSVGLDGFFASVNTLNRFYIMSKEMIGMKSNEIKSYLTGKKFAVRLSIHTTSHLTPQQITTLIGTNTIWTDTNGTNTITYQKRG